MNKKKIKSIIDKAVRQTVEELLEETNVVAAGKKDEPGKRTQPVENRVHVASDDAWASP